MYKLVLVVITLFSIIFNSCSQKPENVKVNNTNRVAREKSLIPKSLDKLDKYSEDLYQSILDKDWNRSEREYQNVQEEFYTLSPYLIKDSIPVDYISALEASVKNLQTAIKEKNRITSLTESNNITRYMCDVADYFITDYPSNLRRIHVFTRNVEISAFQDKWDDAKDNFKKVNAFFPKVKDLLSVKSTEKVKSFEDSLVDFDYLLNKKDLSKVLRQTQVMRDRTAALEKYYESE